MKVYYIYIYIIYIYIYIYMSFYSNILKGNQDGSNQIKTDQRGSRQIKGYQCDLWVGVRGVGVGVGGFQPDQSRSRWTKGDQGGSKEINMICG